MTGDEWRFVNQNGTSSVFNFSKIKSSRLKWSLKKYVVYQTETVSMSAGYNAFMEVWRTLFKAVDGDIAADDDFRFNLLMLVDRRISKARAEHKLHQLYRAIQWYIWCAERYPELGFSAAYSMELEAMRIPGGPKGEAVRTQDIESGPLHRTLELPLIISALRNDSGTTLRALQERAAVALSLALGRNPINLTHLLGTDFEDITPIGPDRCYVIQMPRIKKRQIHPRDDRREEYLSPEFARHIVALKSKNASISTVVRIDDRNTEIPKPLFLRPAINQFAFEAKQFENLFNVSSHDILNLVKAFVSRHNIISPITGNPLDVTVRRLRYTLATNLAADGISKRELARILDHSDTQHVQVYFDIASNIVPLLDKAVAKSFSKFVSFFKGDVIDESEAENFSSEKRLAFYDQVYPSEEKEIGVCGKTQLCHLDPPFSCYLCPKFRPYKEADHAHVLEFLINERNDSIRNSDQARLGVQMDEVIAAVAQVVKICEDKKNG